MIVRILILIFAETNQEIAAPTARPSFVSPCSQDLNRYNTEVFIMDRTLKAAPLKVTEIPATKLYYSKI